MWSDDGFVIRYPDGERPPDTSLLLPDPDEVERLVVRQLGSTAMFSARFREAAGRALLLPRRRPGARAPLWQLRKRASDLLAVAARFGSFPIILETYRECLRDIFDLPALTDILRRVRSRSLRVVNVESQKPSPFSASLLFGYVANYIYDGDAPLAERRAQALSVDQSQLRDLIGDTELRDLLDESVLDTLEAELQHLPPRFHARSTDAVHDLLLRLGDLSRDEIEARSEPGDRGAGDRRARQDAARRSTVRLAGERAVHRRRGRRALSRRDRRAAAAGPAGHAARAGRRSGRRSGAPLRAHARAVHEQGRQRATRPRRRGRRGRAGSGCSRAAASSTASSGRAAAAASGATPKCCAPSGSDRWRGCGRRSSRSKRRRSAASSSAGMRWRGRATASTACSTRSSSCRACRSPRRVLEREILPARIRDYSPAMLDTLLGAGEVTWVGVEPLGDRDGRIALYLTDHLAQLLPPDALGGRRTEGLSGREAQIVAHLHRHGASFFGPLHDAAGGGFPQETVDAIWDLVWKGLLTNDTLHALRAYASPPERTRRPGRRHDVSIAPPDPAVGRRAMDAWCRAPASSTTTWATAMAQSAARAPRRRHARCDGDRAAAGRLLARSIRCCAGSKKPDASAAATSSPASAPRSSRSRARSICCATRETIATRSSTVTLSATDPANPYGVLIPWPLRLDEAGSSRPRLAQGRPLAQGKPLELPVRAS